MREHMTLANTLNAAGFMLGLASTLVLFFSDQVAIGVLGVLLAVGVFVFVFVLRWRDRQPNITVLNHEKTLTLEDKDGDRATQHSEMKIRTNRNGVERLRLGAVKGDGPVKNIIVDPPPSYIEEILGFKEVYKIFRTPLGRGDERDIKVTLTYEDSYKDPEETWKHPIALKTKSLSAKIVFPNDR